MEARRIAKQIAYARIATGAALMVTPKALTDRWIGPIADLPGGQVLTVAFGARDLAVGAGTAYALRGGGAARPWLLMSAFADAVDAVATFATRRALPSPGAPGIAAVAASSAMLGLWAARELP